MSIGLDYAAELTNRARLARGLSLATMAEETRASIHTINRFERGETTPSRLTREKLEHYFGWQAGLLTQIIDSDTPWQVADIDELTTTLPEAQLSDDQLLWEITQRLQTKDDRIHHLEERVRELEAELEKHGK